LADRLLAVTERDEGPASHEPWSGTGDGSTPDPEGDPNSADGGPGYTPPPDYTPPPGYTPPPDYTPPPGKVQPPAGPGWTRSGGPPTGQWPQPDRAPEGGIHPLNASGALTHGWALFRSRWRTLAAVLALVLTPAYVVDSLWYLAHGPTIDRWLVALGDWTAGGTPTSPPDPLTMPPAPLEALGLMLASQLVLIVAGLIAGGAAASILGWAYGGGSVPATRALGTALARVASLVGAWLITLLTILGILLVGGIAAGILAGALGPGLGIFIALIAVVASVVAVVFVSLRWALVTYAIILEGHGPMAGLGRSWRLVAGSTWRMLGYVLLIGLLIVAIGIAFGTVAATLAAMAVTGQDSVQVTQLASRVASLAFAVLISPWTTAILMLLYYDLRLGKGETLGPPAD
jgi:hypothetical protein